MKELSKQCNNLGSYITNALNESKYDSNIGTLHNDIRKMKFFKELGCELDIQKHKATIYFPENTECPDEIIKFINNIKNATSKKIHSISGYFSPVAKQAYVNGGTFVYQGTITFHYFLDKVCGKVNDKTTLYHVCSEKNVASIRKNGLILNSAKFVSNSNIVNGKSKDYFNFQVYTYHAIFAVYKKSDCKLVAKDLEIKNPHIVSFKAAKQIWYDDELMNNAYENKVTSSVYTLDNVKAENIIDVVKL